MGFGHRSLWAQQASPCDRSLSHWAPAGWRAGHTLPGPVEVAATQQCESPERCDPVHLTVVSAALAFTPPLSKTSQKNASCSMEPGRAPPRRVTETATRHERGGRAPLCRSPRSARARGRALRDEPLPVLRDDTGFLPRPATACHCFRRQDPWALQRSGAHAPRCGGARPGLAPSAGGDTQGRARRDDLPVYLHTRLAPRHRVPAGGLCITTDMTSPAPGRSQVRPLNDSPCPESASGRRRVLPAQ